MTSQVSQLLKDLNITNKSVLDIGSRNINGSFKDCITHCEYTGFDKEPGEGVNVVGDAHAMLFPGSSFDVVACLHMLGHDKAFWRTIAEIHRVVKVGGLIILTAPKFGFPSCEACPDYYRFSRIAFTNFFKGCSNKTIVETGQSWVGWGSF